MADDKQNIQNQHNTASLPELPTRKTHKAEKAGKAEKADKPAKPDKGKADKASKAEKAENDKAKTRTAQMEAAKPRPKPKADPEQQRLKKEEQARTSRRRNRQLLGFALTILIIVGAISIVRSGIELAKNVMDNEEERLQYQELLEPMVWFNIIPFDSISQVDENSIKQVSIWGVVNQKQDELTRNERGELMIPVTDVEQYAAALFGPDFRFSIHAGFTDPVANLTYNFNEETNTYAMPVTSQQFDYLANVVEIQREAGGVRRVVIGYVSTRTGDDQMIATPDYDNPAFYRDFMLRRDGSEYYLYAIQPNTSHAVAQPAAGQPQQSVPTPPQGELEDENTEEGAA